eukprot:272837_1
MSLSFLSSATTASSFSCKFTPNRTESLIIGYCCINGYSKISMDLIRIIILFFNQLLYWKINIDSILLPFRQKLRHCYSINGSDSMLQLYEPYDPPMFRMLLRMDLNKITNLSNIYPNPNTFNFEFMVKVSSVFVQLQNKYDEIESIVLRIRIFCVENKQEIEKILIITSKEYMQICNYSDIQVNFESFENILEECMNIGTDLEILHILYSDGNYWSNRPYSWFADIINGNIFLRDKMEYKHINYFNSLCFMIDNQHYYLLDTGKKRHIFFAFIKHYCKEIMGLPYDILLLKENDLITSLFDYLSKSVSNESVFHLNVTKRDQYERKMNKREAQRQAQRQEQCIIDKHFSKIKTNNRRKYQRERGSSKIEKMYRNNKRKYQYNRW